MHYFRSPSCGPEIGQIVHELANKWHQLFLEYFWLLEFPCVLWVWWLTWAGRAWFRLPCLTTTLKSQFSKQKSRLLVFCLGVSEYVSSLCVMDLTLTSVIIVNTGLLVSLSFRQHTRFWKYVVLLIPWSDIQYTYCSNSERVKCSTQEYSSDDYDSYLYWNTAAWWSSWGIWGWCKSAGEWSSKVKVFPDGNELLQN